MNLDDESALSAYLDDELGPADRRAVECLVESTPRLADQLRSIALARDAVAALDRPTIPRDLGPELAARLLVRRRKARSRSFARPVTVAFALSSFSTIAACLIFAMIRLNQSLHETPERPVLVAQQGAPPSLRPHPIDPASFAATSKDVRPDLSLSPPSTALETPRAAVASSGEGQIRPLPFDPKPRGVRSSPRGILARPHVRRVVIVTDVIDAAQQVSDLILHDARRDPNFARISIQQEIVLDLEHPEAAEVFAVPIDERGRRSFVEHLQQLFPDLIEEGKSSPELVTQLGEVGQVAMLRGLEAAPLGDPPHDLSSFIANRQGERPSLILEADRNPLERADHEKSASNGRTVLALPDRRLVSTGPDFVGPPDRARKAPPRPDEAVTLLVWVTRPRRH